MGAPFSAVSACEAYASGTWDLEVTLIDSGVADVAAAPGEGVGDGVARARGDTTVGRSALEHVDRVLMATHLAAARCTEANRGAAPAWPASA